MPIYRRKQNKKRFLILAILTVLIIGMVVSFSNNPMFTEIVLYP